MTNPDLRTLAAEAIRRLELSTLDHVPDEAFAAAVLAAVLPEHRRMVLGEAADSLTEDIARQRKHYGHERGTVSIGRLIGMEDAQQAIRRLAAAAPPAGLSAPVPAGNAPAVPEEAGGQRAGEGGFRLVRRTDAERADYLTQKLIELMAERDERLTLAESSRLARMVDDLAQDRDRLAAQVARSQRVVGAATAWRLTMYEAGDPELFVHDDERALIAAVDALPDVAFGPADSPSPTPQAAPDEVRPWDGTGTLADHIRRHGGDQTEDDRG